MAEMQESQVRRMTLEELKARINSAKPYILADARDVDSYNDAHIPGAIPVPAEDVSRLADNYDRDLDVITYCGSYECQASTMAAREFVKKGFRHVRDYKGGIKEWIENGNPVESNR
ncbi:MAG: molybdopterin biosynthesis protein MoeB [Methanocella sp. PtaU1.Bin125]|nr:MAG: molybdopterin biosynthesis protein MoeB [Methanocella sp. PtaU1.Bin125]